MGLWAASGLAANDVGDWGSPLLIRPGARRRTGATVLMVKAGAEGQAYAARRKLQVMRQQRLHALRRAMLRSRPCCALRR